MTHEVEGEGYRSVVRLVLVSERLVFIGGLFVEVDGAIAGQQVLLPANAVQRRECCMAEEMSARSKKRRWTSFQGIKSGLIEIIM